MSLNKAVVGVAVRALQTRTLIVRMNGRKSERDSDQENNVHLVWNERQNERF